MNTEQEKDEGNSNAVTLFGDGTMLIKVDGVAQRRRCYREVGVDRLSFIHTHKPELNEGEELMTFMDGGMCIVTVRKPSPYDAEKEHNDRRVVLEKEVWEAVHALAHHMGTLSFKLPAGGTSESAVCVGTAREVQNLIATVDSPEYTAGYNTALVDATAKVKQVLTAAIPEMKANAWRVYLDSPLCRDMGKSRVDAVVEAMVEYVLYGTTRDTKTKDLFNE